MKGFERSNPLLSLCGLNCGLCPMHLNGHCPRCGGGTGNQSCRIARCSIEHGGIEYCSQCSEYPCEKYLDIDEFDSFITHRNQTADLSKAMEIGIDEYNAEQLEKIEILTQLLTKYNDGRRKTFYCTAVNLLDLQDIRNIMAQLSQLPGSETLSAKEKAVYAVRLFQELADKNEIELKLRRKS